MNRAQRRANPDLRHGPPPPQGPLYQADIRLHLGADKLWQRPENVNTRRIMQARSPEGLWAEVTRNLTEMVGLTDSRFVLGLFLNIINRWPDEARTQMLVGIMEGWGLTIEKNHATREATVTLGEKRDENGELVFKPLAQATPDGDTLLPSGLIIPKAGVV